MKILRDYDGYLKQVIKDPKLTKRSMINSIRVNDKNQKEMLVIIATCEPPRGKTNNVVSEQV